MKDLLRTVSYFTSVGQSLSAFHVWQFLYRPEREWTIGEVKRALEDAQVLSQRDGRFVLRGYEHIFDDEQGMYLDSDRKFRKARKVASLVSMIPGVRAVSVCNSLAWESTNIGSDTDFLVICKPGRLWLARFLAVGPLILLKMRPGERKVDPVDFTFFVSDRALDLSSLAIDGDDPYLTYWIASLIPLIDDGVMESFFSANNWVSTILPNSTQRHLAKFRRPRHIRKEPDTRSQTPGARHQEPDTRSQTPGARHKEPGTLHRIFANLGERFLVAGEKYAKKLSHKRFPEDIRYKMNKSSHVIVNDDMLKFHVEDDRIEIRDNWKNIYEQIS